jgi:hypothetical protein
LRQGYFLPATVILSGKARKKGKIIFFRIRQDAIAEKRASAYPASGGERFIFGFGHLLKKD